MTIMFLGRRARCGLLLTAVVFAAGAGTVMGPLGRHEIAVRTPVSQLGWRPALWIDRSENDFGVVLPGSELLAEFTIRNSGGGELSITNLDKSCGCTMPKLASNCLAPGEATALGVEVKIPPHPGSIGHFVTFNTNDPDRRAVKVLLLAKAQWPTDVLPGDFYLGVLPPGRQVSRVVEVFSTDGGAPLDAETSTSQSWIGVEEVPASASHCRRFRVTVTAPSTPGRFDERVTFRGPRFGRASIDVAIRGEVSGSQRVTPARLLLGTRERSAIAEKELVIHSGGSADPVRITSVEVRDSSLEVVRWGATRTGDKTLLIKLSIKAPSTPGYHSGTLVLAGTEIGEPLDVPIGCMVH